MKRIDNSKIYIAVGAVVLCILIALAIRLFFDKRNIQAFISPIEVYIGDTIHYTDNSIRAQRWTWEFGNGDISFEKNGSYIYKEPGLYQVRLTVDGSMQKEFYVNIRERIVALARDTMVAILGPDKALQGELITFRGEGNAQEWRWSFGETYTTDARTQTAIYAYQFPGVYEVELSTEFTEYPVMHRIEIVEAEMPMDYDAEMILMGNDIRQKLQNIVDGKPFNQNYNYILSKYMCDRNPKTQVVVNNEKYNDFYSYCQGLKIIGKYITTIVEVKVVLSDDTNCVERLFVTQYSK